MCLKLTNMLQLRTVLVGLFGYPYNNGSVISCKDSPDYLDL